MLNPRTLKFWPAVFTLVAVTVLMLTQQSVTVGVLEPDAEYPAVISQSPPVSVIEVILVPVAVVSVPVVTVDEMNSPISPAAAEPVVVSPGR